MKLVDFVRFFGFLIGMIFVLAMVHIVFGYKSRISYTDMMIVSSLSTILYAIREKRDGN